MKTHTKDKKLVTDSAIFIEKDAPIIKCIKDKNGNYTENPLILNCIKDINGNYIEIVKEENIGNLRHFITNIEGKTDLIIDSNGLGNFYDTLEDHIGFTVGLNKKSSNATFFDSSGKKFFEISSYSKIVSYSERLIVVKAYNSIIIDYKGNILFEGNTIIPLVCSFDIFINYEENLITLIALSNNKMKEIKKIHIPKSISLDIRYGVGLDFRNCLIFPFVVKDLETNLYGIFSFTLTYNYDKGKWDLTPYKTNYPKAYLNKRWQRSYFIQKPVKKIELFEDLMLIPFQYKDYDSVRKEFIYLVKAEYYGH